MGPGANSLLFLHESSFVFPETDQISEEYLQICGLVRIMEFLSCILNAHTPTSKLSNLSAIWQGELAPTARKNLKSLK